MKHYRKRQGGMLALHGLLICCNIMLQMVVEKNIMPNHLISNVVWSNKGDDKFL